ncbi:MAG: hypothetical protein A3D92_04615 [Bacteroidetes bacterium RIFCSPHIGHO2_02_FULL_44_7]|nr:MAG: hypothetical protein A3D92_04615 [Bacteroidetes bacterium RIFCSPHIGHO2_02_FULL_44_7]
MRSSWLLILGLFIFTACGEQPLYEKVVSFDGKQWKQDVTPVFKVKIDNVDVNYNFTLNIRTTTDYKYSNLWIFLKTETPDGQVERKPFQILIANPDGSWVGNKTGTVVETPLVFRHRKLPLKGEYTFTVEQGITHSEVDEVLDIGFRVEVAKSDEETN